MSSQYNLQVGDVVHVPLYGFLKHYGVVIHGGSPFHEPLIRTVLREKKEAVTQTQSEFSNGQKISIIPYPSQLPRWQVVDRALSITDFKYSLLNNNCEHFYRRVHGLSNCSPQVIMGGIALLGLFFAIKSGKTPIT